MTPYEAAFGKKPDLKDIHKWGEKVWVHTETGSKLGGCICEGRWLGIDERSKGVHVHWPEMKTVSVEWNIYVDKMSAHCFEGEENEGIIKMNPDSPDIPIPPKVLPAFAQPPKTDKNQLQNTPAPRKTHIEPEESHSEPETHPKCIWKPTQHVKDILQGIAMSSNLPKLHGKLATGIHLPTEPQNDEHIFVDKPTVVFEGVRLDDGRRRICPSSWNKALEPWNLAEAKSSPDWALWDKAIQEELSVLKAAGTWELVDAPKGANIIGSRWVFWAKNNAAGNVVCYKARLVAQGFLQVPGVDYFDTFAPVTCLSSIQAVLAIAAVKFIRST